MTTEVVSSPEPRHACNPGWEVRWSDGDADTLLPAGWYYHPQQHPPGTVLLCDCGKTWIAEKDPRGFVGMVVWTEEGRFARWRRERRTGRVRLAVDNSQPLAATPASQTTKGAPSD